MRHLGLQIREKRLRRAWSQWDVARQIGATQSQVSAVERGLEGILSTEKIRALVQLLEIDLHEATLRVDSPTLRYCPSSDCPTSLPFAAGTGPIRFRPTFVRGTEKHCRFCGETTLTTCPNPDCKQALDEESAFHCPACSQALVPDADESIRALDPAAWSDTERARRLEMTSRPPIGAMARTDVGAAS